MKIRKTFVKTNIVLLLFCSSIQKLNAQFDFYIDSAFIDTVGIQIKSTFEVEDFIRMTQQDTSFYKAFKNLKMFPHSSISKVTIFNKQWEQIGLMERTANHFSNGKQGWIDIQKETTDGKFYNRKGEHKFFTAEMYDKVFFQTGKFDVDNIVKSAYQQQELESRSKEEKYYEQLKTFMFSPGTGVDGVPLIGKKLEIFEGKMTEYYDYTVEKVDYLDSLPCYKFSVTVKEGIHPEKVVITNLTTFYDRRTMNIIARRYNLAQSTALFSFDIKMYIRLDRLFYEYLPSEIKYNGEWDVPFKKPERITFEMYNSNYSLF